LNLEYEKTQLENDLTRELIKPYDAGAHHMNPVVNISSLEVWVPLWNADGSLKEITHQEYNIK